MLVNTTMVSSNTRLLEWKVRPKMQQWGEAEDWDAEPQKMERNGAQATVNNTHKTLHFLLQSTLKCSNFQKVNSQKVMVNLLWQLNQTWIHPGATTPGVVLRSFQRGVRSNTQPRMRVAPLGGGPVYIKSWVPAFMLPPSWSEVKCGWPLHGPAAESSQLRWTVQMFTLSNQSRCLQENIDYFSWKEKNTFP